MMLLLLSTIFSVANADVRSVELAWGNIEGATAYELKIMPASKANAKPLYFKTRNAKWSGKVKPGEYHLNIRSYDRRGVPGPWSEKLNFWAKIPSPVLLEPKNDIVIESTDEGSRTLNFDWKSPYNIGSFKLIIASPVVGFEQIIDVESTSTAVTLPVGLVYEWRVQAVQPNGELGDLADKPNKFTLLAPALEDPKLLPEKSDFMRLLTWNEVPRADEYKVRVLRARGKSWQLILEDHRRTTTEVEMPLQHPAGKYRLEVQATAAGRKPSSVVTEDFILRGGYR